jgi:hypothetical protein
MEKYKPNFLGKVMPADNPGKLTDFVTNKYNSFNKVYDACKDHCEKIDDVKAVESEVDCNNSTLSVRLLTDADTIEVIKKAIGDSSDVSIKGDVITGCVTSDK